MRRRGGRGCAHRDCAQRARLNDRPRPTRRGADKNDGIGKESTMNLQAPPVSREEVISTAAARAGNYRWVICGLLFAATAINYVDRQILGVLKPTLQHDLHWDEVQYAFIVTCFQGAYAVGYLGFGRLIDRIGAKLGFAGAIVIWTIAHVAHAAARTAFGFTVARIGLGLGESGNFPAGVKAVAEW